MSGERVVIEDLTVLGNAVPDSISDDRITVCTVGYAPSHGLVRIYPVPPRSPMKRWNVVSVPLERNPRDSRAESWKIQGSRGEWDRIAQKIVLRGSLVKKQEKVELVSKLLGMFGGDCIEDFNDRRVSLGMVRPSAMSCALEKRTDHDPMIQTTLEGAKPFLTVKNYPFRPMLTYRCASCRTKNPHNQEIVEWGVFEGMRQNPAHPEKVFENLHIGEKDYDSTLLVGNMNWNRNSFLVVSIFRFKRES